jgi:hypothetical protein
MNLEWQVGASQMHRSLYIILKYEIKEGGQKGEEEWY